MRPTIHAPNHRHWSAHQSGHWAKGHGEQPYQGHRRGPRLFLAMIIALVQVGGATVADRASVVARPLDGLAVALLLLGPAALTLRRTLPLTVYAITLAADVAYLAGGWPHGPYFLAALVALFGAIRRAKHRPIVWAMTGTALVALAALTWAGPASVGSLALVGVWLIVAVLLAEAARIRGEHFAAMRRSAAEATRARREHELRQASDERLRIARELHDVLGHHLSLINVRAGVALHLLDPDAQQTREALEAIKLASAEALREVRTVLASLDPHDSSAPRTPAPGLADVDSLIAETRSAGLPVSLHRQGEQRPLPSDVERAAYRIIQESLTNVRRHAGPSAHVTVLIGYEAQQLTVEVADTGNGLPPISGESTLESLGSGVAGMRVRAETLGGTLRAGTRPDGGFLVAANLPAPAADPATP